jgi:hypothetical protein
MLYNYLLNTICCITIHWQVKFMHHVSYMFYVVYIIILVEGCVLYYYLFVEDYVLDNYMWMHILPSYIVHLWLILSQIYRKGRSCHQFSVHFHFF